MSTIISTERTNGSADGATGHARAKKPVALTPQLDDALENAEYLLKYAAEAGIEVDPDVAQCIIEASRDRNAVWDGSSAGVVLAAITKLAAKVHPVTGETLRTSLSKARAQIRQYTWIAVALAFFIVPLSMISFITSGLSASIAADLLTANQLAVTLHAELEAPIASTRAADAAVAAPSTALPELQQFATTMRSIKDHTELLNIFLLREAVSPLVNVDKNAYELSADLSDTVSALQAELTQKTYVYQRVRLYAKEVQDDVALFYGSITACLLPMLYALLGACAYLLRLFSQELNSRTFSPSYAISARFFIALIGGMIVGLFGNLSQGTSLSPLALAFLVGYAADVFFSFLEGLLVNFKKMKSA